MQVRMQAIMHFAEADTVPDMRYAIYPAHAQMQPSLYSNGQCIETVQNYHHARHNGIQSG